MATSYTIHLGTIGGGLATTRDRGQTWHLDALPADCNVRTLASYAGNAQRLLAGTDSGLFRSEDNGRTFAELETPIGDREIWSLAVDPHDPETLFVGSQPEAFRSKDGGQSWDVLEIPVTNPCPVGVPRITNIIVDPRDANTIWAGIEVDGVYRSRDRGDTWSQLTALGEDPMHGDVHGMALRLGDEPALFCSTPYGICTSTDEGQSWSRHEFPKFNEDDEWSYCRGMLVKADDPGVMFVGNGDTIPGVTGAIRRTTDGGRTWGTVDLPVVPNSVVFWLATHAEVPDIIVAISVHGYVYLSEDGGDTWEKLAREFAETRAVLVTPQ